MFLQKIAPKKFIYCQPLVLGALFTGCSQAGIFVIMTVASVLQAIDFGRCERCPEVTGRNAHALCISAAVYSIVMMLVNLWFIWGIKKKKSSVVLGWIVMTAMWHVQGLTLVLVLIGLSYKQAHLLMWQLCVAFALFYMIVTNYLWFVVYGYFLELRNTNKEEVSE